MSSCAMGVGGAPECRKGGRGRLAERPPPGPKCRRSRGRSKVCGGQCPHPPPAGPSSRSRIPGGGGGSVHSFIPSGKVAWHLRDESQGPLRSAGRVCSLIGRFPQCVQWNERLHRLAPPGMAGNRTPPSSPPQKNGISVGCASADRAPRVSRPTPIHAMGVRRPTGVPPGACGRRPAAFGASPSAMMARAGAGGRGGGGSTGPILSRRFGNRQSVGP